jgi:hypothetical protein
MHKLRINISVKPKNSEEVCFDKTRQFAQVGCKNLIFLSRKIIYVDPAEKEKHFYKKIYIITLCHFWHRI